MSICVQIAEGIKKDAILTTSGATGDEISFKWR